MLTEKQRALSFAIVSILVLSAFGWGIAEKEEIKTNGQTVWMELAPVDPRSLMQGDYMALRYRAAENIMPDMNQTWGKEAQDKFNNMPNRGYAVFAPDVSDVARFVRIDDEATPLKKGEFRMRFHKEYGRARLVPDSFMFQEGMRQTYQPAHFGIFKVDDQGHPLLTGLADVDMKELVAKTQIKTE